MRQPSKSGKGKLPLTMDCNNDVYYNYKNALSRKPNMVISIGGRGIGKTTSWLIKCLKECDKGFQFIYLRRYKPELKAFNSLGTLTNILPNVVTKPDGNGGFRYEYEGRLLGYGMALSTTDSYKSVAFPKVRIILYDEAILKPKSSKHYLPNETTTLLEFMSTVYRTRTDTLTVILGNNMDLFNPYFSFFKVPIFDGTWWDKRRGLWCEKPKNSPKLLELEKKTPLYALVEGTSYAEYHYENEVLTNAEYLTMPRPKDARVFCRLTVNGEGVTVTTFERGGKTLYHVERSSKSIDPVLTYDLTKDGLPNLHMANLYKVKFRNLFWNAYFSGNMVYSDDKAGGIMTWIVYNL